MKIVLAASLLTTMMPHQAYGSNEGSQLVSVKLQNYLGNVTTINLLFTGEYVLSGHPDVTFSGSYTVKKSSDGNLELSNGDKTHSLVLKSGFTLVPKVYGTNHSISVNGITYLGNIQFTLEGNVIRPINTLSTEDYLKGVVPYEMSNSWELEAQKAQAVAARTYALSKGAAVINDTTTYQVYKGYNAANAKSIQAVNETQGKVLKSGGKYISALYSATNGGWQMSNTNVWGSGLESYLPSKADPYSVRAGQHLNWWFSLEKKQIDTTALDLTTPNTWWNTVSESTLDKTQISEIKNYVVRNKLIGVNSVNDFKITDIVNVKYDPAGDAKKRLLGSVTFNYFLKKDGNYVMGDDGNIKVHTYTIEKDSDDMRVVFSSQKSPYIQQVEESETTFKVIGSGYGHGVGMSQWGAQQMAKEHLNYEQILAFYYEGASLENENTSYSGVIAAPDSVIVKENGKPTEVPSGVKTYTVQEGDTRWSIANQFGITIEQLTEWNGIQPPYYLYKGTLLIVSEPTKEEPTPTPEEPKDTTPPNNVTGLKATVGVDMITLSFTKPSDVDFAGVEVLRDGKVIASKVTATTYVDKELKEGTKYTYTVKSFDKTGNKSTGTSISATTNKQPVEDMIYHTVKAGETLWKISQLYGVSTSSIQQLNGLSSNVIHVGQKLKIKEQQKETTPPPKDTTPPREVTGLKTSVTVNTVKLTFTKPSDADFSGVEILRDGKVIASNVTGANYEDKGLKENTKYTYTVKTFDKTGNKSKGTSIAATTKKNTTPPPTQTPSTTYTVKKGDTLSSIAKKYNTTYQNIMTWNQLKTTTIYIGQTLKVNGTTTNTPNTPSNPTPTTKKTGKVTASTLNMRSGAGTNTKIIGTLKKNEIVTVNSVSGVWAYVTAGSKKGYVHTDYLNITTSTSSSTNPTTPPSSNAKTHKVKSGDTLFALSVQYNVSVANIKSWNKLSSNTIRVGQVLTVRK